MNQVQLRSQNRTTS